LKHLLRFALALGIVALPAAAHAQITGGLRAGANFADLSFDPKPPVDSDNLVGLVAGAFVTIPVNDVFAFQPEALFSMQGTKFSDQGLTFKTKVDYMQFPALARVRVAKGSPVAILAGPSFGLKTNASFEGPNIPDDFSQEFDDSVRKFDFGLVAGACVEVGHFVLDGRYTWGLTNIAKESALEPGEPGSAKHRVFSFSAGVRF
jgi:Outer membrane protein beta-barrel domain